FGVGRAEVPRGVRVLALAPPGQGLANRGVAQAQVIDGAVTITLAGTPGAGPAAVTVRLRATASPGGRSRDVGRALVSTGSSAAVPLPSVTPGWWLGEAVRDPDELRAASAGGSAPPRPPDRSRRRVSQASTGFRSRGAIGSKGETRRPSSPP